MHRNKTLTPQNILLASLSLVILPSIFLWISAVWMKFLGISRSFPIPSHNNAATLMKSTRTDSSGFRHGNGLSFYHFAENIGSQYLVDWRGTFSCYFSTLYQWGVTDTSQKHVYLSKSICWLPVLLWGYIHIKFIQILIHLLSISSLLSSDNRYLCTFYWLHMNKHLVTMPIGFQGKVQKIKKLDLLANQAFIHCMA